MNDDDSGVFDGIDTSGETGVELDDPEQLHKTRRLQQIHDARERFDRGRLEARGALYQSRISELQYHEITCQLALDYLKQLEPLIRRSEPELLNYEPDEIGMTLEEVLNQRGERLVEWEEEEFNGSSAQYDTVARQTREPIPPKASHTIARLCDDFLDRSTPVVIQSSREASFDVEDVLGDSGLSRNGNHAPDRDELV